MPYPAKNIKSPTKPNQLTIKKGCIVKLQAQLAKRPKSIEQAIIRPIIKASDTKNPVKRPKPVEPATVRPIKRTATSAVKSAPVQKKKCIGAGIHSKLQGIKTKLKVQTKPLRKQSELRGKQSEQEVVKSEPLDIQSVLPLPVYIPIINEPKPGDTKPKEPCTGSGLQSKKDKQPPLPSPPPPPGYLIFITTDSKTTDEFILPDNGDDGKKTKKRRTIKPEPQKNTKTEERDSTNIILPRLRVRNQCTHHEAMPEQQDDGLPKMGDVFNSPEEFIEHAANHAKDWFFYHTITDTFNPEKEPSFKKNNGTLYTFTCKMNSKEQSASTGSKSRIPKKCPARLTLARFRGETEYKIRDVCHHHSHRLTLAFNHHPYFYTVPEEIIREIMDLAEFHVDQQLVLRYINHKLRDLAKDNVDRQLMKFVSRTIPYNISVPGQKVAKLVQKYYRIASKHRTASATKQKRKSISVEKLKDMWKKIEYIKKAFNFPSTTDETVPEKKPSIECSQTIGKVSSKSAIAKENSINVMQCTISYEEEMEHFVDQIEFVDCSKIKHETATNDITSDRVNTEVSTDVGSYSEAVDADTDEIATDVEYLDDTIYADTDDDLTDVPADSDVDDQFHDSININYEQGETKMKKLLASSKNLHKQTPLNKVSKTIITDKEIAKFNKKQSKSDLSGMTLLSLLNRNGKEEPVYDELACVQEEIAGYDQNQTEIKPETSIVAAVETSEPKDDSTNKITKSYIEKYAESITRQISDVKKTRYAFQYSRCFQHGVFPEYKAKGLPQNGDVFNSKEEFEEYVANHAKDWFFTYALVDSRATRAHKDINEISSYYMFACKYNRRRRYREHEYKGLRVHKKRIPDTCPAGLMIKRDRGYVDFTVRQACHHHNHEMSEQLFKSIQPVPMALKKEIADLAKLNVDLGLVRRYMKSQIDLPDMRLTKLVYNHTKIGKSSNKMLSPERYKELLEKVKYLNENFGIPHKRRPPTRKIITDNDPKKYRYLNIKKGQKKKRKTVTKLLGSVTDFELVDIRERDGEMDEEIKNNVIVRKAKAKKINEPVKVSSGSRVEARLNSLMHDQELIRSVKAMQKKAGCNVHISTDGGVDFIQNEKPEMQNEHMYAAEYSAYHHDDNTAEQIEIDQEVHVMDENDIIPDDNLGSEVLIDHLTTECDQQIIYLLDIPETGSKTVKQNIKLTPTEDNVECIQDIQSVTSEESVEDVQGIDSVKTEEYIEYTQGVEPVQTDEYVEDMQGIESVQTEEYIEDIESVETNENVEFVQDSTETEEYVEQFNYENNNNNKEDVYEVYEENGEDYQIAYEYTNNENIKNLDIEDVHVAQSETLETLMKKETEMQADMENIDFLSEAKTFNQLESEFVREHAGKIEFSASTRGRPKVPLEEAIINRYNIEFYISLGGITTCMEQLATNMNIPVLELLKHVYQGKAVLKMTSGRSGKFNRKTVHLTFVPLTMAFPYENKFINGLHQYKTLCSKYSEVVVGLENTVNSISTELKILKEELNTTKAENERLTKLMERPEEKRSSDEQAIRDKKRIKKLEEVVCLMVNRFKSGSSIII